MNLTPNRFVAGLMAGVASALLVAAAPVAAASRDNTPPPTGAPATAETAATTSSPANAKPTITKYCIYEKFTGSRLTSKTCKTKAEWEADGVDITAK